MKMNVQDQDWTETRERWVRDEACTTRWWPWNRAPDQEWSELVQHQNWCSTFLGSQRRVAKYRPLFWPVNSHFPVCKMLGVNTFAYGLCLETESTRTCPLHTHLSRLQILSMSMWNFGACCLVNHIENYPAVSCLCPNSIDALGIHNNVTGGKVIKHLDTALSKISYH